MILAWLSLALWVLGGFLLTLGNGYARTVIPLPPPGSGPSLLPALLYLALLLFVLMRTARAAAHLPQSAGFLFAVGLALAAPYATVLVLRGLAPFWLLLSANSLFLPAAAVLVGASLGRMIRHPNTLLAGAAFAGFFDIVVVTMGTVAVLLHRSPRFLSSVSLGGGAGGSVVKTASLSLVTVGPADLLSLAVFLAAVAHLGLGERATFAAMFGALFLGLAVAETTLLPVPALVPMGIAVIAVNARHARFTRDEKFALVYGSVFALLLAAGMVAGARHLLAR